MDSPAEEGSNSTPTMQPHREPTRQHWPALSPTTSKNTSNAAYHSDVERVTNSVSSMNLEKTRSGSSTSTSQPGASSHSLESDQSPPFASAWSKGPNAAVLAGAQQPSGLNDAFAAALLDREKDYAQHYGFPSSAAAQSINGASNAGPTDWNKRFWTPRSDAWDPKRFYNEIIRAYECPHSGCKCVSPSICSLVGH